MPNDTRSNMLAIGGLAPNPYGPGTVPYDYSALLKGTPTATAAPGAATGGTLPVSMTGVFGASPQTLASDVSASNLNAIPNIDSLTTLVNQINSRAQQQLNADRLGPQGQAVQNQLLSNAGSYAAGQLPSDVINNALFVGAESGAGRGFGVDSAATNAAVKRALGLDTVALNEMAQKDYLGLLAANPSSPLYGAQNNLVTPGVYAATADRQAQLQYEYAKLASEIALANQRLMAGRGGGGGGGGGTTPTTTTTPPPPPSMFPSFKPSPIATSTAPTATPITPFDFTDTLGGASAVASGGDPAYQDWVQWYDPFGFGDWSQGYGNNVPPGTYYDSTTDTSNYDYGLGDYYFG